MSTPERIDPKYGQLALARGHVGLSDLIRCVESAGQRGRALPEVLLERGFLSEADHQSIVDRLAGPDDGEVKTAIEASQTLVLDSIQQASESLNITLGAAYLDGSADEDPLMLDEDQRYEIVDELGRGGMGVVYRARDRVLLREVALKTVRPDQAQEKTRSRLLLEARVTGLLEHPNIAPVYSLSRLDNGEPFYTMRVVRERSLEELLGAVRKGEERVSLAFLVQVLRQVSLAIQYAHDTGIIHRDLKPENILLGEYGEVYVIDWGIAKILQNNVGLESTGKILMGALVGTPQYMSPEQARGESDQVGPLSDVYALGAILYEIITGEPLFDATHVLTLLFKVVNDPAIRPSERAPDRTIPADLEEICMRALAKNPDNRYPSAQAFADELDLFLEGVKEVERRNRKAKEAHENGEQSRAVYKEVRDQHTRLAEELEEERRKLQSWSPAEEKARMWSLEQQVEDLEVEWERRFGEAVRTFGQALVHVPDHEPTHNALAALYWDRFVEAERDGNRARAAYFEGLVRQHDDGTFAALMLRESRVRFETNPSSASVRVFQFHDVQRRLEAWEVAELGTSPAEAQLSHGSYLARIEREGYCPAPVPFVVKRGEDQVVRVKLVEQARVPDDFVFVAATVVGPVDYDFAMKKYPVTCGEYLEFLNGSDPEIARKHAPRVDEEGESYFPMNEAGIYTLPDEDPDGDSWNESWPIIMVNYHDAVAYAEWRSRRDSLEFRLPTVTEWEIATRGADARLYPWGNDFDAAFCRVRESRQGRPLPAPVGEFEVDESPFGVCDLAGNVAEITSTMAEAGGDRVILKGASYNSYGAMASAELRQSSPKSFRYTHYGFRLVLELGP